MGMAGGSLKENAAADEDTVVQREQLTARPGALGAGACVTALAVNGFWWPRGPSLQSWYSLCSAETSLMVEGWAAVVLIQCGCDRKCGVSDHDVNPSLLFPEVSSPHRAKGKQMCTDSAIPVDRHPKASKRPNGDSSDRRDLPVGLASFAGPVSWCHISCSSSFPPSLFLAQVNT